MTLVVAVALAPAAVRAQEGGLFGDRDLSGWRATVRTLGTWDSNVRLVRPDGDADVTSRLSVEGARLWQSPRERMTIALDGAFVRFRSSTDLNRNTFAASLSAMRRLTRRATGTFDYRGESALTDRTVATLGDGPLLTGLANVRIHAATGELTYRQTREFTTAVRANFQHVAYDAPQLLGGWSALVGAEFGRQQSRSSILRLDVESQRGETGGRANAAQRVAGAWELRIGPHVDAQLRAGLVATALDGVAAAPGTDASDAATRHDLSPLGGAVLRLRRARDLFDGEYDHSVGQVFGRGTTGLFVTDALTATYDHTVTGRLHLHALTRHVWGTERAALPRRLQTTEGSAELRYAARRGLVFTLGALTSHRTDLVAIGGQRVTLGVGYGWSQLRAVPPTTDVP